ARGVAEGAAAEAGQRFVALAQVGVQRAGAQPLLDLHAEGVGLGPDEVVGGGSAARVVLVFVQAGGRVDPARAGQPQLLARGARIQAHRAAVVVQADAHAAAVAAFPVVVAIVVGAQRLAVDIHGDMLVLQADGRVELVQAVAAHGAGHAGRDGFAGSIAALGDDVDDAAGGAAAVLHGAAAAHDLDALDALQRHGAQRGRRQVIVVLWHAVDQHQRVARARQAEAADVDRRLLGRAGAVDDVDAGLAGEQFLHRDGAAGADLLRGQHRYLDWL